MIDVVTVGGGAPPGTGVGASAAVPVGSSGQGSAIAFVEAGFRVVDAGIDAAVARLWQTGADAVLTAVLLPDGRVVVPRRWSPTEARHWMVASGVVVVARSLVDRLGGLDERMGAEALHDLLLRAGAGLRVEISHTAASVAPHGPLGPSRVRSHAPAVIRAAGQRLSPVGVVEGVPLFAGAYRPRARTAGRDLVTVIVPTRDRPDLLEMAHATIRRAGRTRIEVIFVDNGTTNPRAAAMLGRTPHRVVSAPIPFNFARLVNRGAAVARGRYIVLLNNDVEALEDGWLDALLEPFADPDVGVGGSTLLYPSGTIQHCGIVLRDGIPQHALVGVPLRDAPDWVQAVPGERTAVTGACLAIRADLWRHLGGMSSALATNYNDVDLCLRAWRAGARVVCTPYPGLVHHESLSRGARSTPEVAADWLLFRSRWAADLGRPDPWWPVPAEDSAGDQGSNMDSSVATFVSVHPA